MAIGAITAVIRSDRTIAKAVITDIDTKDFAIISDNPNNITKIHMDTTDVITPINNNNNP